MLPVREQGNLSRSLVPLLVWSGLFFHVYGGKAGETGVGM